MAGLPFETATQLAALGLTLAGGWFLGLASHPGGGRWRLRYQEAEEAQARAETERDAGAKRIAALEAEVARLREGHAPPVANESGAGWRGWFGWGRDNLSRINGVDAARERRLNELGIKTYREIEKMAPDDEAALEQRLDLAPGTIAEQGWREQAALLRAGNDEEHGKRFG